MISRAKFRGSPADARYVSQHQRVSTNLTDIGADMDADLACGGQKCVRTSNDDRHIPKSAPWLDRAEPNPSGSPVR